MAWPPVSRNEDKGLAHYAIDEVALSFPIAIGRQDALMQPDGRRQVVEAVYDALSTRGIAYALERYDADPRIQHVRPPETILGGAREGTCLDLALLFAGIALGKHLAPLLVMLEGHAFVAVSLDDDRDTAAETPRRNREGAWLGEGILRDDKVLRRLVDTGHYLAVECTGFARSSALPPDAPEGKGRVDGKLSFDSALKAGRAQLDFVKRPFRFAIDFAVLRDRDAFAPYDPPLAGNTSPFRVRLERLIDDERLFGGRDDELRWLDNAIDTTTGGYVFVTGGSGSGKTALLVNWIRALLALPPDPAKPLWLAYTFISQKYGLSDEQPMLELLCQQVLRARGQHESLPNNVPALQAKYIELLAEPAPSGGRIVVVIDGLDEAEGWTPSSLIFPRTLPPGLHVVFSAREEVNRDWLEELDLDSARVLIRKLAPLDVEAVEALLKSASAPLALQAADATFVQALHAASGGDPFYLKFLIEDLDELAEPSLADVKKIPGKLNAYLDRWWNDVAKQGKAERSVRDLLCYLVVALGPIRRDDLVEIDTGDELDSFTIDDAVKAVKRYVIGSDELGYTLCHPRFRDYLVTNRIRPSDQRPYIARLTAWCASAWPNESYCYPAEHVISHLAAARAAEPSEKRAAITAQMLAIANDATFAKRRLGAAAGFLEYERDFREVVRAAVTDPLPAGVPELAHSSLRLVEVRRGAVRVAEVFEAALDSRPEVGARQLPLIAPDHDWLQASLLVCAWLCARHNPNKARQFLATQVEALQPDALAGTLELLHARVVAAIENGDPPPLRLPYFPGALPQKVSREVARAIVERIEGATDAETIAAHLDPSMIGTMADHAQHGDETPTYIAEGDSPWLVGYAVTQEAEGHDLIIQYISGHAQNPYGVYRNRSLWGVLGAVLCHPTADLALDLARSICKSALHPAAVEYREMLFLSATALAAKLGDADAAKRLQDRIAQADSAARELDPIRSQADPWGQQRRRLAALAELLMVTADNAQTSRNLLDLAASRPFGYAGYGAPANLAIADANFVCRRESATSVAEGLDAAQRAAHNVQEARFCALTTARVNAIRRRWWPGTVRNLVATVERFVADPLAAEFAPVHIVGERYEHRSQGVNTLPIPPKSLDARTLEAIASHVYGLPVAPFERLNPGVDPRATLYMTAAAGVPDRVERQIHIETAGTNPGMEVNVSDSAFGPILAARFAAELLGRRGELDGRAVDLIAKLVPAAAMSATALDVVLARLALAAAPYDISIVRRIAEIAPDEWLVNFPTEPRGLVVSGLRLS